LTALEPCPEFEMEPLALRPHYVHPIGPIRAHAIRIEQRVEGMVWYIGSTCELSKYT
jgi:hypothetical protein